MFAAESYARTTTRPTTTTTPRTTATTKKMSLMELLQQRKKMMEGPPETQEEDDFFAFSDENPSPAQSVNAFDSLSSSGESDICANQIMGQFIRLNSWYTDETGMSGVSAKIELTVGQAPSTDFEINVQFTVPVHNIEVWTFLAIPSDDPSLWQFKKKPGYSYSSNMDFDINTLSPTPNHEDISAIVVYCDGAATNLAGMSIMGQAGLSGSSGNLRPNDKSQLFEIQNSGGDFKHRNQLSQDRDVKTLNAKLKGKFVKEVMRYPYSPRCEGSIPRGLPPMAPRQSSIQCAESDADHFKYDLKRVLCLAGYFYKAQRVGPTPSKDVPWRGISGLKHGCDIQKDIMGGWYDAGDNVIFTFPLAYAVTMLSWSMIEFKEAFQAAGEYDKMLKELKWGTDFLIRAHISKFELVGLIGDPELDHKKWIRPEDPSSPKTPTFIIDAENPGSELAAEASAALAAAHLVFRWAEKQEYADLCLEHAQELFEFADTYRGVYHDSIPKVYDFYRSWEGYEDELSWAAIWLYGATSDEVMLTASMAFYKKSGQLNRKPLDWDNKWPGVRLLLARLTQNEELARESLSGLRRTISSAKYTPKGLIFLDEWGPLRHAANHAFLAFVSTKLDLENSEDLLEFGKKQMFYIYGEAGRSYIVGFGKNYPTKPHHRSSSCPVSPQQCGWDVADDKMSPNPWILFGALVGGPDRFDSFINDRKNHQQSEVTLDYNAALIGGTAGLLYYIDLNYLTGV